MMVDEQCLQREMYLAKREVSCAKFYVRDNR